MVALSTQSNAAALHSVSSSGRLLIPRSEQRIARTIARLRTASFSQDPLMSVSEVLHRFDLGLSPEARRSSDRGGDHGRYRADAVASACPGQSRQAPPRRCAVRGRSEWSRRGAGDQAWIVARFPRRSGSSRTDLVEMPGVLRAALPLFPIEHIHFHIVFISGTPPIREGLTLPSLKKLYGFMPPSTSMLRADDSRVR